LLPQAPDRPRAFCPGHHTPRTVLPRDLGRSHHVITPTRPPKAPSRANWSASGPLSRTSPLPARHHPPPCILPKPPPRQLVWRWATPGPFDQAPDHPRTAPVPFRSGAHPPPDLLPQAPCPPGGAPPSPATPAPGPHEGAWAGEGSRGKNPGCRLPRRHPQVAPRWPTGPAPGQTAKPPVRPGEWVPLRPTGSGFRQRRRTPKTPRRGSRKPEEGTVVSATRLLDRVHDPLGHFSRLQRIHPRAR
ncbi:hypothetical protein P170DRAFT_514685, partial [Aspergillus steynii IBT 23096]